MFDPTLLEGEQPPGSGASLQSHRENIGLQALTFTDRSCYTLAAFSRPVLRDEFSKINVPYSGTSIEVSKSPSGYRIHRDNVQKFGSKPLSELDFEAF